MQAAPVACAIGLPPAKLAVVLVRNGLSVPFDTTPLADVPGRWAIVLANLFADTLVDLADALIAKAGDHLILGGILADREKRVRDVFDPRLGQPDRSQDDEWVCLHYHVPDAWRGTRRSQEIKSRRAPCDTLRPWIAIRQYG